MIPMIHRMFARALPACLPLWGPLVLALGCGVLLVRADELSNPVPDCPCCDCYDLDGVTLNGSGEEEVEVTPDEEGKFTLSLTLPSHNDSCEDCGQTTLQVRITDQEGKSQTSAGAPGELLAADWKSPLRVEIVCLQGSTDQEGVPCKTFQAVWEDCEACDEEGGSTCPPSGENGSVDLTIPLGSSGFGTMPASLRLHLEDTVVNPGRSGLWLRGWSGIAKTTNAGGLASVTTARTHAVIADTPTTYDPKAYTVTLSYDPLSPGGSQFRTVVVENVSGGALRVSTTFQGTTEVMEWSLTGSTWTFLSGNGLRKVEKTLSDVTASYRAERVKTYERDPANPSVYLLLSDVLTESEKIAGIWQPVNRRIDPDGADLVSTWSYYAVNELSGPSSYLGARRLKEYRRYDGYYEYYNYSQDGSGQQTRQTTRPFGAAAQTEIETRVWDPAAQQVTVTRAVGATETFRQVTIRGTNTRTVRRYSSASAYLQTVSEVFAPGSSGTGGLPKKVTHPDGTLELYSYAVDGSGHRVTTVDRGAAGGGVVVEGTRTVTRTNPAGVVEEEQVTAISAGAGNGIILGHRLATATDVFGRATEIEFFPLNPGGAAWTVTRSYTCCGLGSESDRYGIVTTYAYDALRRRIKTNRLGVTEAVVYAGLTQSSYRYPETPGAGGLLALAPSNEMGRTVRNLPRTVTETWQPSPQTGALVKHATETLTYRNPEGTPVDLGSNLGLHRVTEVIQVADDGSLLPRQTELSYVSGELYRTWGDLEPARQYSRYPTYRRVQQIQGIGSTGSGGTLREYEQTTIDRLGRTTQQRNTAGGITYSYYNTFGQLARVVDPDAVNTRYAYNAKGERTVTAHKRDGTTGSITWGSDQITSEETFPALRGSEPVLRTETRVWKPGDTSPSGGTVIATVDQTPDGLRRWTDRLGVSSLESVTVALSGGGDWTETTVQPDGSYAVVSYLDGLPDSTVHYGANDAALYSTSVRTAANARGYDALNRPTHSRDGRTGVTVSAYVSLLADAVASVTDPGGRVTAYTYDHRGRTTHVDAPDTLDAASNPLSNITVTQYYPDDQVKEVNGGQTYRVSYTYDYAGRPKTLTTYGGSTATTTWNYSTANGRLTSKLDHIGNGPSYTYTLGGRLATRTWARGVVTTYGHYYGRLNAINYSDGTPPTYYNFDALGRVEEIFQDYRSHVAYTYDPVTLALDTETVSYNLDGSGGYDLVRVIDRRALDTLGREKGWQLKHGSTVENEVTYGYDAISGRLNQVDGGSLGAFTYGYTANSPGLLASVTGPVQTVTNTWDSTRDLLTRKENQIGSTIVSSYAYTMNALGQREGMVHDGTAHGGGDGAFAYRYNAKGEVATVSRGPNPSYPAIGSVSHSWGFAYDGIGNREAMDLGGYSLSASTVLYAANALNQYTAIDSVSPSYDVDGNATDYPVPVSASSNAALVWDGENRLISSTVGGVTITYLYDVQSRRIAKTTGGVTTVTVYDGWNPIADYQQSGSGAPALSRIYQWGLDLSGSLQGAGGVGGMLSLQVGSSLYYPQYDGNGNVTEYLTSAGAVSALFLYDAYGNTVVNTDTAGQFDFRFSSKRRDVETGLYYYGYRYYDPVTGRWPSRDPIAEEGGVNLYGFVENDGVNNWDLLGLFDLFIHTDGVGHFGCEVLNVTWDIGRYMGKYKNVLLAWGPGPNLIRKSNSNPNKSKKGFQAFIFDFGADVDKAVNSKFQSVFDSGQQTFPSNIKNKMPKGSQIIPANMRYTGQDWTYNNCNCITETKSSVIEAVRSFAETLPNGERRENLNCFADDLEKIDHLKPEDYADDLRELEEKYKNKGNENN